MKNQKTNTDSLQSQQKVTEKDQALTSKNMSKKERTRKEHILKLSKKLSKVTDKQKEWVERNCVNYYAYYYSDKCTCLNCSEKFDFNNKKDTVVCPNCKKKLILKETRWRTYKGNGYFAIAQTMDTFQIIRNFKIHYWFKINKEPKIVITEVLQHWIDDSGEREVYALKHYANFYMDSWKGDFQFRNKKNERLYDIYPKTYYPYSTFKQQYRKIGIDKDLKGLTFLEAIKVIPDNPKAETLLKAKYYAFLYEFNWFKRDIDKYWSTIKIAIRNQYHIRNVQTYFDYLGFLKEFNKDLLIAKYVCPSNLSAEHKRYVRKSTERRIKKMNELERMAIIKADDKYYQEKIKKFMGFIVEDNEFVIRVFGSVEEIANEGKKLRHCVFLSDYHKKDKSLLLSARLKNRIDEPLETIEIPLPKNRDSTTQAFDILLPISSRFHYPK